MARTKIVYAALIWIVGSCIIFLAFCFVNWDMNPGNWSTQGRYFFAILALLMVAPAIGSQNP